MERQSAANLSFLAGALLLAVSMIVGLAGQRTEKGNAVLILSVLFFGNGIACLAPLFIRIILWILMLVFAAGMAESVSVALLGYPLF